MRCACWLCKKKMCLNNCTFVVKPESVFAVYSKELQQDEAGTLRLEMGHVWSHMGVVLVNVGDEIDTKLPRKERATFVSKGYRVSYVLSPLLFRLRVALPIIQQL